MSSISRRRNGLMALSVIGGSCLGCGLQPLDLKTGRLLPATPRLTTNYRQSGLVHRRFFPVAVHPGEGLLTERTADARACRYELVLMPHSGRSSPRSGLSPVGVGAVIRFAAVAW